MKRRETRRIPKDVLLWSEGSVFSTERRFHTFRLMDHQLQNHSDGPWISVLASGR